MSLVTLRSRRAPEARRIIDAGAPRVGVKPIYFDLTVKDVADAKRFFAAVLGWTFEEFGPGYFRIRAGEKEEAGIDGGVGGLDSTPIAKGPMTVLVIPVADLDEMVRRAEENGGHVLERRVTVPGIGYFASCSEPGGLIFGMLQPDPAAK